MKFLMRIRVNSPWCILICKHCLLCMRLLKIILPLLKTNQKNILCYCGLVAKLCPTLCYHARLPCSLLSPRVCLNSSPSSWWCHPTISSSVTPFSFPQPFPASGYFPKDILSADYGSLEKAMAPHSSTLARKTPWTEEPGRLQSMGSLRVRHDWSDLAAAAVAVW